MNPVQIRLKAKWRFRQNAPSHGGNGHNDGRGSGPYARKHRYKMFMKHGYWTTPGSYGHAMYGGKVPTQTTPKVVILHV